MQAGVDKDPILNFLGIRVEEVGDDRAKASIDLTPQLLSVEFEVGRRHINAVALDGMAAVAAGIVASEVTDPTTSFIMSQNLNITHLAQPRSFPVTAEAQLVHRGKHMIVTDVVLTDAGGYPVQRASITWAVVSLRNRGAAPS
jgi:uncharacterized protein (TIGR00369 family)